MSVMLYKYPGEHKLHDDNFDYIIVEEGEVEATIKDGWSLTTTEAKKPKEEPKPKKPVKK